MFKTPQYWSHRNLLSKGLLPLSWLYQFGQTLDRRRRTQKKKPDNINAFIISIGNITMGGSGKTPVVKSLVLLLQNKGYQPHIITRGYRGNEAGPLMVDLSKHTAIDVGDEALLHAKIAPTWVSKKKEAALSYACEKGADIIFIDDGHQSYSIFKDYSLLIVDGNIGLGNQYLFPAGPLRESITEGLKRADAIIYLNEKQDSLIHILKKSMVSLPIIFGHIQEHRLPQSTDKQIYAFTGIAYPQKFLHSLKKLSFHVKQFDQFPDHHYYSEKELEKLCFKAQNLPLYTTEKDWVRLPKKFQAIISYISIDVVYERKQDLEKFFLTKLQKDKK